MATSLSRRSGLSVSSPPPVLRSDGKVYEGVVIADKAAYNDMSVLKTPRRSTTIARCISGEKRTISSSTSSIDDTPGSQGLSYLPRSIKRLRLDHETAPLVPPPPQPKLRMHKITKQPSDSSLTTEVTVPDPMLFPSRTLDTVASLRSRVKALEVEVRKERAARDAAAAAHRADKEKAREDRRALVRKLQKALEAFEGLKERFDGLHSQVWERQKEILDKLGRSFEPFDVDAQNQETHRLNQVMRKLEAVQTYLEKDGVATAVRLQRTSRIPTPPSSASASQQSQSASAGHSQTPRSKRFRRAKDTKDRDAGSGRVGSDASADSPSTDVDDEAPSGLDGPGNMSRTQLIDINEFVNDDGEYTTSVEQIPQSESPSAVLRRPVTFNELQDRQVSMSRRSDVPGSSYGPFYDPLSSFEAIDCKMNLTVDESREYQFDSSQSVPALVEGGEGTGAISDDSQPVPVTPQNGDNQDDDGMSSDAGMSSDGSSRVPLRLPHPTTSKPPSKAGRSVPPARGGRGVPFEGTSTRGRSRRRQKSGRGNKSTCRTKRPSASSDPPAASDLLRPGTGYAGRNGRWPPKAAYTLRGRAQEIVCDICQGRAHWCCAGLMDDATPPASEWECPDCVADLEDGAPRESISSAPQDICIRGDCVMKAKKKLVRKPSDKEQYFPERIIGRRAVSRNTDKSRNFEYLVKWVDWPVNTSTWEPPDHIRHQKWLIDDFLRDLAQEGLSSIPRVNLLPEATKDFDVDSGELREPE